MVLGGLDAGGGDEDLITPEDRDSAAAHRPVAARLAHDSLEYRDRLKRVFDLEEGGKLHAGLVVVLGARERRKPSALAGGVVNRHRGARCKLRLDVDASGRTLDARLLESVQCAQAIASTAVPVLVDDDDSGWGSGHGHHGVVETPLPAQSTRNTRSLAAARPRARGDGHHVQSGFCEASGVRRTRNSQQPG